MSDAFVFCLNFILFGNLFYLLAFSWAVLVEKQFRGYTLTKSDKQIILIMIFIANYCSTVLFCSILMNNPNADPYYVLLANIFVCAVISGVALIVTSFKCKKMGAL